MSGQILPPSSENFTLGLAGFGTINHEPSEVGRTVLPVSRQLIYPPTELEINLSEQKRQVYVISLLQQRLKKRDRGVADTLPSIPPPPPRGAQPAQ